MGAGRRDDMGATIAGGAITSRAKQLVALLVGALLVMTGASLQTSHSAGPMVDVIVQ
jgi:hypothetical protein